MAKQLESISFRVAPEDDGSRIDRLVARQSHQSRRVARLLIATGRVQVNGRIMRILSRPIRQNARIDISAGPLPDGQPTAVKDAPIPIIHIDTWVVAVNKPARLLTEPDRFGSPALEQILAKQLQEQGERPELWLVHRLDAVTSGVVLLARNKRAAKRLSETFRIKAAHKTYLALADGRLRKTKRVDAAIARVEGTKHGVTKNGKPSQTEFQPLASTATTSLIRVTPLTGRTHQIRVHLAHIGHPILGDRLYSGPCYRRDDPAAPIGRAMLHALHLTVPHPATGESLELRAVPPPDFRDLARVEGVWVDASLDA